MSIKDQQLELPLSNKTVKAIDLAITFELASNRQEFILNAIKEKIANLGLFQRANISTTTDINVLAHLAKSLIKTTNSTANCNEKETSDEQNFIIFLIKFFTKNKNKPTLMSSLKQKAEENSFSKDFVQELIQRLIRDGFLYQPKPNYLRRLL